jgi:hypothetical protein
MDREVQAVATSTAVATVSSARQRRTRGLGCAGAVLFTILLSVAPHAQTTIKLATVVLDQIQRKEEQDAAQRCAQQKGQHVRPGEAARSEQGEWEHGRRRVRLEPEKASQQKRSRYAGQRDGLDERENNGADTGRRQCDSRPVEPLRRVGGARLRHAPERYREHDKREWKIDEEDPAPGEVLDEPAAKDGAHRSGDRRERRPRANGATAFGTGNDALIRARLPGTRRAAPTPCKARAAMSSPIVLDKPHNAEHAAKMHTPNAKILRRPRRSPSDPPVRRNAASVSA